MALRQRGLGSRVFPVAWPWHSDTLDRPGGGCTCRPAWRWAEKGKVIKTSGMWTNISKQRAQCSPNARGRRLRARGEKSPFCRPPLPCDSALHNFQRRIGYCPARAAVTRPSGCRRCQGGPATLPEAWHQLLLAQASSHPAPVTLGGC